MSHIDMFADKTINLRQSTIVWYMSWCMCAVKGVQPECVLQVFFACSDGSLFALCPVAPFHAAISLSDVDQLVELSRCSADDTAHSTTQAWLDQVIRWTRRTSSPSIISLHACQIFHGLYKRVCTIVMHVHCPMQQTH